MMRRYAVFLDGADFEFVICLADNWPEVVAEVSRMMHLGELPSKLDSLEILDWGEDKDK